MTFYESFILAMVLFLGLSLVGIGMMVVRDIRQRKKERNAIEIQARLSAIAALSSGATRVSPTSPQGPAVTPQQASEQARARLQSRGGRGQTLFANTVDVVADVPTSLTRLRWTRVFRTLFLFWMLCYPGISVRAMRVFKCRLIDDEHYLAADLRIHCYDAEWSAYASAAAVVLFSYTLALPIAIAIWLRANASKLGTPKCEEELGFLYSVSGSRCPISRVCRQSHWPRGTVSTD